MRPWTKSAIKALGVVRVYVPQVPADHRLNPEATSEPIPGFVDKTIPDVDVNRGSLKLYRDSSGAFLEGSVIWAPVGVIQKRVEFAEPAVGDAWTSKWVDGEYGYEIVYADADRGQWLVVAREEGVHQPVAYWMSKKDLASRGYKGRAIEEVCFIPVDELPD